jgi:multicomponent Na+:H+ antiporter subunit G
MDGLLPYIGLVLVWLGVLFSVVGVIGLFRFPDVFSRIHAAGKVATLGIAFLTIGTVSFLPELFLKGVVLVGFLILTAPVSSHAIAVAAHRNFRRIQVGERDDLADARDRAEADPAEQPLEEELQPDVLADMPDDVVDDAP